MATQNSILPMNDEFVKETKAPGKKPSSGIGRKTTPGGGRFLLVRNISASISMLKAGRSIVNR